MTNRRFQSIFCAPPMLDTIRQRASWNIPLLRRLTQLHRAVWCVDEPSRPPISGLGLIARPLAIFRTVGPIIVDAVNGSIIRPYAHVREKVLEDFPTLANCNPASAIVFICRIVGVRAPIAHSTPSSPSRSFFHAVAGIFTPLRCDSFFLKATATPNAAAFISARNFFSGDGFCRSAVAYDKPVCTNFIQNGEPTKFLSNHGGYIGFVMEKCKQLRNEA